MNEQETREKIVEIINNWAELAVAENRLDGASVYNPYNAAELADALIEAGIGDVKEAELERKAFEVASNQYRIWFEEAEHRAEIAETALQYAVSEYHCDECPCLDCTAEIRDSQECIDCICEEYKKQAEKDLAEEADDE